MKARSAAARAAELRAEIARHDFRYYVEAAPMISDAEYDALFRELAEIEREHPELVVPDSPTQRVGSPLPEGQGLEKRAHSVPMLSIDSLFTPDEVREFEERIRRFIKLGAGEQLEWVVEPKYDGASTALVYEKGVFTLGLTRGDGEVGEVITSNLRTVRNLPLRLHERARAVPSVLEVRGEILIERAAFVRFNRERERAGKALLANPRNAAAGALRRNDPAEVARYPLQFQPWAVVRLEGASLDTHWETLAALRDWGFPVNTACERARGLDACLAYHAKIQEQRESLPFEVDGIVAKLDRLDLRERLGRTARSTRWQFAFKFPANEATSTLRAIQVTVGATGRVTPLAHVDPVQIGGVTVVHSTLHNADIVQALDLHIGDRIFVRRAGDVIPQVMGVAQAAQGDRPADWEAHIPAELLLDGRLIPGTVAEWRATFAMPERCPDCGTPLVREGKFWRCPNMYACRTQVVGRTLTMSSAYDIDRLGEKMVEQLFDAGLLHSPADLFYLDAQRERLLELERWGEKSVANLLDQIARARNVTFERFLAALGINDVGSATARAVAQHFTSLEELRAASVDDLQHIEGIGPEVAASIREWFDTPENGVLLARLAGGGVVVSYPVLAATHDGPFSHKTVVFTGTLSKMGRAEAKHLVESLGGRVASAISAKTDFLVTGEGGGGKRAKAAELGIRVLDEAEFLALAQRPA
jgi:DNA ligase (NAD+)